mmetsp:Transcript_17471/g.25827  ORF Transcript_17471/g.25827 Transcript_17471/m.25827 type:complete len:249 (+) Transcript_17471:91-837(+)
MTKMTTNPTQKNASIDDDVCYFADYDDTADHPILPSAPMEEEVKHNANIVVPEFAVAKQVDLFEDAAAPQNQLLVVASPQQQSDNDDDDDDREMACTIASVVLGSCWLGPMGGILVGAGSAYAVQTQGLAGDIARAMGDVALLVSYKVVELNTKHDIVKRSRASLYQLWKSLKDYNRRFRIVEKAQLFVVKSWKETVEYARRKELMEKGLVAVSEGMEWFLDQILAVVNSPKRCIGEEERQVSSAQIY